MVKREFKEQNNKIKVLKDPKKNNKKKILRLIKTKQNEKLRERLQYEKPSVTRRAQKLKAQYVESQKPKD